MKKVKNVLLLCSLVFLVGSVTSCKVVKKIKAKRCKCPTWSHVEKECPQQEKQKAKETFTPSTATLSQP